MSAHPAHAQQHAVSPPAPRPTRVAPTSATHPILHAADRKRIRELQQALRGMMGAVSGEIEAVLRDPRQGAIAVDRGRRIVTDGASRAYELPICDSARGLRLGDDVGYEISGAVHPAVIVGFGRESIRVVVGTDLGDITPPGLIRRNTLWLLESLKTCLGEIKAEVGRQTPRGERYTRYARALLGLGPITTGERTPHPLVLEGGSLHPDQALAIRRTLGSQVLYLWGPPGTGKTHTLARIVEAHYRAGRRVLVLGPSNAAVDLLMVQVAERLRAEPGFDSGLVLRFGSGITAHLPSDIHRALLAPYVARHLLDRAAAAAAPDPCRIKALEQLAETLRARKLDGGRSLRNGIDRLIVQHRLAGEIARGRSPSDALLVEDARELAVRRCRVLGTTLTQRYVSPLLMREHFDVVMVDEASMVSAPALVAAAGMARQVVVAGDFRQLPPVVRSKGVEAQQWLTRDPFTLLGIPDDLERGDVPPYVVMLSEQRRMAPAICDLVAPTYLHRLTTHSSIRLRSPSRHCLGAEALLWIDSSPLQPRLEKVGASRANRVHAGVVWDLIRHLNEGGLDPERDSVLVLSPFRAQAQLLQRTLRDADSPLQPRIGTVHTAQGDEADIVILDLTDAPPEPVSPFLQADHAWQQGARLLNVALSRARRHIVLIGDFDFLLRNARSGAEVKRIIEHFQAHGLRLDFRDDARPAVKLRQHG